MAAIMMKNNLERTLNAGFTTVRDAGFANLALKQAVEYGYIKGPRLLISCSPLAQTDGGFEFGVRDILLRDTRLVALPRICDGVDEVRKAAREQFRDGADQIKIEATPQGYAASGDIRKDTKFSLGEIKVAVEEAVAVGKQYML